jgi:phosphatidylglycerophosphate synthase
LHGVPLRLAGASVVLDKITEALSQILFTLLGLLLVIALRGDWPIGRTIAIGLAMAAVPALAPVVVAGRFRALGGRFIAFLQSREWPALAPIRDFADALHGICRADRVIAGIGFHLAAWMLGTGEVWVALRFMGHPIGLAEAVALESLGQAITSAGFMVPAALGVQEAAYVAVGGALGLPVELALSVSLVKRIRQVLLGLPALFGWQLLELRELRGPSASRPRRRPRAPSSDSNSYLRRLVRGLLRPLVSTGLSPNHLTALRIASGLAACVVVAAGRPGWSYWGAVLWAASAMLYRADGEFARLTGHTSEWGRKLDYYGDVAINALVFLSIGIGLRNAAYGRWFVLAGIVAAASVAMAAMLAEELETKIGSKTIPSRWGFDFDDIVFVLTPAIWLGVTAPLAAAAALGGPAFGLFVWLRLSRFAKMRRGRNLTPVEAVERD